MSTPQWQNLPVPESGGKGWAGFSADPRDPQYQQLRASDADRSTAATMLGDAYAEGRLDNDEYQQRLDQAMSSKNLGELVPVLSDIVPAETGTTAPPASTPSSGGGGGRPRFLGQFPRWWLGLAVMFNLIWLMTVLGTGHLIYYWPMWPMLGTAIPMIMGLIGGGRVNRQDRIDRGDQRAIDRGYQPPENDLR